jgi:hypothetical protein
MDKIRSQLSPTSTVTATHPPPMIHINVKLQTFRAFQEIFPTIFYIRYGMMSCGWGKLSDYERMVGGIGWYSQESIG